MRAAVLYGKEDVRIENVEPARLKPGEVRIAIGAALTCGTDLKVFKRGYHARMIVPPAAFGHELAGTICEVARDGWQVTGAESPQVKRQTSPFLVGERVVVANSAPCGSCFFCQNHQENLCDDLLFLNGAYAESIAVPARFVEKNLLRLKSGTAFCDAALTEPLACVVQGIEDTQLRAGQKVLVIGAGPIGLMFVALAKHLGCIVTVAGRGEARLRAAQILGADRVIDASERGADILSAEIMADPASPHPTASKDTPYLCRQNVGSTFDAVIEAVGKPETWEAAVRLVRKGGTVNFFGGCPSGTSVSLDTSLIHYSSLTLLASFHHTPRTVRRALDLIESGIIRAKDFVDGECALDDLPDLFSSMATGNRAVKTLVQVRGRGRGA